MTFSALISSISLYLIAISSPCYAQSPCDSTVTGPLFVPIQNVSLADPVVRRGAAIAIGTPPQPLAFQIQAGINNTFVYDSSGLCDANTPPIQCLGRNGGAFEETSSSTWVPLPLETDDHTDEFPYIDVTANIFGLDTLQWNSSTSSTKFPIHIPRNRNGMAMNALGLGKDSTVLNALYNSGVIASRSWSVFGGLMGADSENQMDGSLVLGGYDAAKLTGDNYTEKLVANPACSTSMVVTVTDMEITSAGQPVSLLGQQLGNAIRFCLEPAYPIITIPEAAGDVFRERSSTAEEPGRSLGLNLFGLVYDAISVYRGDLTITFKSGLKVTIPNDQLVVPDISVDTDGQTVFNSTTREVLLNPLQEINRNDMPILGMTLLTSAYLNVNYDENSFSLWQAKPTIEQKLVGVGKDSLGCEVSSDEPERPNGTADSSPERSMGLSTGSLVGVVVGAIAGLAIILATAAFLLLRRRKPNTIPTDGSRLDTMYFKPELASDNYRHTANSEYRQSNINVRAGSPQEMPVDEPFLHSRRSYE